MNILFNECLEALQEYRVLSAEETLKVFKNIWTIAPIVYSGQIDWDKIDHDVYDDPMVFFKNLSLSQRKKKVVLCWDDAELPSVETTMEKIFLNINDVACVSVHKYLLINDSIVAEIGFIPENFRISL